jgi:hypothetical protein
MWKNVFYRLRDRDLIEPVPGKEAGPASAWMLKQPTEYNAI